MNFFRKNLPTNRRSQIAVIITFVIAVIFLFIAVFINLAKVSQVKTTTSTSADKAALGLASQLGSMSHYYKEKVLKGGTEKTTDDGKKVIEICGLSEWVPLAALILTAIATGVAAFVFFPAVVPLAVLGAASTAVLSSAVLSGINTKFREMSGYNAMRENALFQSLSATQSDDVELKAVNPGGGNFYEDINNNGVFDKGEPAYNLTTIPEMRNEKKVSRFAAWYYTKRFPLVSDESMKNSLAVFISGIKGFIDADERGSSNEIIKLSFRITPKNGDRNYEVTCSGSSCPGWVKDAGTGQLRIVRMDSSNDVYGGFLTDKLSSLLTRLEAEYNGTFCEGAGCKIKPSDLNILVNQDLQIFLLRSKELLNLPVSERLSSLSQWAPLFYDPTKHKAGSRESIDDKNDWDIYLRLSRDKDKINAWIAELETLNNANIKSDIIDDHGSYCMQGQPHDRDRCPEDKNYCCYSREGGPTCACNDSRFPRHPTNTTALWPGKYGTCTSSGTDHTSHPVCINGQGDLYGNNPDWCTKNLTPNPCAGSDSYDSICHSTCPQPSGITVMRPAYSFQGRMSWDNTSGQTEVEQAFRILRALNDDLGGIQMTIAALADAVAKQLPSHPYEPHNDANNNGKIESGEFTDLNGDGVYTADLPEFRERIEIVYAWKDRPVEGKAQYSHFVCVKIDGYPDNLPNVTESVEGTGTTCRRLNNYEGDFTITTSRYDQDQPTDIGKTDEGGWQLRRRRQGPLKGGKEVPPDILSGIVTDVQDNGKIDSKVNEDYIEKRLLPDYAITSCSKAHYGPEKSDKKNDIYITGTKCD